MPFASHKFGLVSFLAKLAWYALPLMRHLSPISQVKLLGKFPTATRKQLRWCLLILFSRAFPRGPSTMHSCDRFHPADIKHRRERQHSCQGLRTCGKHWCYTHFDPYSNNERRIRLRKAGSSCLCPFIFSDSGP